MSFTLYFEKYKFGKFSTHPMKELNGYFICVGKHYKETACASTHIQESLVESLHDKLKSMFPSIQTKMGPRGSSEIKYDRYCFKFKNKADEAYFLLWANDGIKIDRDWDW